MQTTPASSLLQALYTLIGENSDILLCRSVSYSVSLDGDCWRTVIFTSPELFDWIRVNAPAVLPVNLEATPELIRFLFSSPLPRLAVSLAGRHPHSVMLPPQADTHSEKKILYNLWFWDIHFDLPPNILVKICNDYICICWRAHSAPYCLKYESEPGSLKSVLEILVELESQPLRRLWALFNNWRHSGSNGKHKPRKQTHFYRVLFLSKQYKKKKLFNYAAFLLHVTKIRISAHQQHWAEDLLVGGWSSVEEEINLH